MMSLTYFILCCSVFPAYQIWDIYGIYKCLGHIKDATDNKKMNEEVSNKE
jgi:hypothetical protein